MEKSKLTGLLICITVCSFLLHSYGQRSKSERLEVLSDRKETLKQASNTIPSLHLASAIGESVLKEKYGDATIESQKPFEVSLKDDVWLIDGKKDENGKGSHIEICKSTGSILAISN